RYLVGVTIANRFGTLWPYGTFLINVTGSFAIGFFMMLAAERIVIAPAWRYLFTIGFVGAYTTFSTYTYETLMLVESGGWRRAVSYVVASNVVCCLAVWLAARLVRGR